MHGISYVIEGEAGTISQHMSKHSPPSFGFSLQTQCGVDPFATLFDTVMDMGLDDMMPMEPENETEPTIDDGEDEFIE